MPRLTKIYTRGGDDGTTSLGGGAKGGQRRAARAGVRKTVDEFELAKLGVALAVGLCETAARKRWARSRMSCFHLGSDLCFCGGRTRRATCLRRLKTGTWSGLEGVNRRTDSDCGGSLENFHSTRRGRWARRNLQCRAHCFAGGRSGEVHLTGE